MILPTYLKVLYPFSHTYHTLSNGYRLHYVDEGKGEPVVLLHGNPTWSFYYRNLILKLSPFYRCLALDHLGCGLSDKPKAFSYQLERHIEHTAQWLQSLNLTRFHLIVHDWGGAIGMGLLERFHEQIGKVILLNTAVFSLDQLPLSIRICRLPIMGRILTDHLNLFLKGALTYCVQTPLTQEIADGYALGFGKNRHAIYAFVRDIPLNPSHRSFEVLKQIQTQLTHLQAKPIYAFWGMQDFVFHPGYLEEWVRRLPPLQVKTYPEAGHWVLEDAKGMIEADILRALQQQ